MCFCISAKNEEIDWYVDSGATSHICNRKELFKDFDEKESTMITVANGYELKSCGKGTCEINILNDSGNNQKIMVKDVLYVPSIESNLLSVKKLTERGLKIIFYDNLCEIWNRNEILATAVMTKGLYKIKTSTDDKIKQHAMMVKKCVHYWHRVYGHRNIDIVKKVLSKTDKYFDKCNCEDACEICVQGKMSRKVFPKCSNQQSYNILDLIHSDVCGPMDIQTPSGKRFFVTFIDDFSKYIKIYLITHKFEVLDKMKEFSEMVFTKFGRYPKIIRSDRGGEYIGTKFSDFCKSKGIKQQYTTPYTPEQNGVAERRNRYLIEMVRCMLLDAKLEKCYWGEAITTAAFLQNFLITSSANKIPIEVWEGKNLQPLNFEIFGSLSLVHIPKEKRKKLDQKAKYLIFVGYSEESKGLRFLDKNTNKITISRDYKILNNKFQDDNCLNKNNDVPIDLFSYEYKDINSSRQNVEPNDDATQQNPNNDDVNYEEEFFDTEAEAEITTQLRKSTRSTRGKIPERFQVIITKSLNEPKTFEEVQKREDREQWMNAMKDELNSLKKIGTWDLVNIPDGRKPIGCKWVFKIKTDASGNIKKYKARLVAQGFNQKFGVDYDEVFAPVVRQTTFRMFLTLAGEKQMIVKQYDVKTAFLYGILHEDIYMKQPIGFELQNNKVCKLNRSIYGLKQSAKCWNEKLTNVFLTIGFQKGLADTCILKYFKDGEWIFILIYVDDILVATKSEDHQQFVKTFLKSEFEISDLGDINFYLGIKIEKGIDNYFAISQEKYINKIVEDAGVTNGKYSKIPMDVGYLKNITESVLMPSNEKYRKLIGSLLYLSTNTRPDISTAVSILSRKVNKPTYNDWTELKRLTKYLNGTKHLKLKLSCNNNKGLYGFADADWAQCQIDRKSNSGYLFKYNGSCISWSCRKQESVSLSSTEAEYISLSEATQEAIWLRRLMNDFEIKIHKAVIIYEDNQSCLKLTQNDKFSRKTKHIETKFNFVRDLVNKNIIKLLYCPTEQMEADMLTKPLQAIKIKYFCELIGLI